MLLRAASRPCRAAPCSPVADVWTSGVKGWCAAAGTVPLATGNWVQHQLEAMAQSGLVFVGLSCARSQCAGRPGVDSDQPPSITSSPNATVEPTIDRTSRHCAPSATGPRAMRSFEGGAIVDEA